MVPVTRGSAGSFVIRWASRVSFVTSNIFPMHVLVVGNGGREHALCTAFSGSPNLTRLTCAPGNPGTGAIAENVPISAYDARTIVDFCLREEVDLCVIGPEAPLVAGIVEDLRAADIAAVGPTAAAARLEGSKAFAKSFMQRHAIPTAASRTFRKDQQEEAEEYVSQYPLPVVLKADGLAAGKGVVIAETTKEALSALREMLAEQVFGSAGSTVVIEEFMTGEEASVFAVTDGRDYVLLASAQDHKRIGERDTGPNTGGMGAYAPASIVTPDIRKVVEETIIRPTLKGMADEGHPYTGILYVGLMIGESGPKVVEYNCRLGDPEAQVVLPLLETDAVELLAAVPQARISEIDLRIKDGSAACVVLASEGYPGTPIVDRPISGLDTVPEDVLVFHAGTKSDASGIILTSGGRVLGVTGLGDSLREALDRAYEGVDAIFFDGMQYRRDIGAKGL